LNFELQNLKKITAHKLLNFYKKFITAQIRSSQASTSVSKRSENFAIGSCFLRCRITFLIFQTNFAFPAGLGKSFTIATIGLSALLFTKIQCINCIIPSANIMERDRKEFSSFWRLSGNEKCIKRHEDRKEILTKEAILKRNFKDGLARGLSFSRYDEEINYKVRLNEYEFLTISF
jgi:hypothetical protein